MKYYAQYDLTEEIKEQVLEAAKNMCASDTYYPRHINNGENRYGCALYGAVPKSWKELEEMASGDSFIDEATQISYNRTVRWKTCGGNMEGITISGDVVMYFREGRRHGIPNHFRHIFENLKPKWGTVFYETQRPDVSPFEMDV